MADECRQLVEVGRSRLARHDWKVAGVGDFNGDAVHDILWRDANGQITEWLGTANGGFTDNSANAATFVPTNWHVVADDGLH